MNRRSFNESGVALLIVITILVTMVIVAVPFAMSMRQGQERTESVAARSRAEFEAGLLTEIAKLYLVRTHPDQEEQRFQRGDRTVDANPNVDSLDEITPNDTFRKKLEQEILSEWEKDPRLAAKAQYLKGRGLGPLNDDRGSIWTVQIQDAQALVNVNGASPFLLGNLLGSALLSDDLDTGGGDIPVEHVVTGRFGGLTGFPREGGFLRIGREVISYETFDGQVFRGCERGVLLETPLFDNGPAQAHEQGDVVIDYTAYKIATHKISHKPGHLSEFENLEAIRNIASWGENGVISAARLERVLPYLTAWSRRETSSGWLAEQLIVNQLPEAIEGNAAEEVRLRDLQNNPSGTTAYFNAGTIVRVTDGISTVYQSISSVGDIEGKNREVYVTMSGRANAVEQTAEFKGGETRIAAMAPYPININTASREVLYATMANIGLWRGKGKDQVVTPELAWSLAGDIVRSRKGPIRAEVESGKRQSGPFRSAEDFARFLEAKVRSNEIKRAHFQALYMNAINPHSYILRFGTAPWCYRTLDVYHVESRVALNNRAGEQIAEAGLREVVEIGSDTTATWVLDSQDEFEQRLAMGSGAKWATTYPFSVAYKSRNTHHIQPALRGPKGYINNVYASMTRGEDLGDVRLEPARMLLPNAQVEDHFDPTYYANGHYTGYDGALTRKTVGTFRNKSDVYVRPFDMSFWWCPYSEQDWVAFDAGMEQFMNRYAIFVQQGDRGQELTFRCCAGNLAQQGAEVYVPLEQLDYEPGTWYHIRVSCDGEDPASMQMLVDGVDIGKRRGMTYLSSSVTAEATDISVESTDGFPIRGALRIGDEIIEYDSRSDGAFRDCIRGTRGTANPPDEDGNVAPGGREWASGTPVQMLGYSMPITVDVMRGGSHLDEALRKWNAARVSTLNSTPAPDTATITIGDVEIILGGFAPERKDITVEVVGMWGQADEECYEAFGSKGIALLGCPEINVGGTGGGSGGPAGPGPDDGFGPGPGSDEPPTGDGGNHDRPGDSVDPGRGDGGGGGEEPAPTDPGDPPVPVPDDGGGAGDPNAGSGSDVQLGGWEVVYYERSGNQFTITRYQETKWQAAAEEYFLITENRTENAEFPAFLVPISVMGTGGSGTGEDYLDPADPLHEEKLLRYYPNGDASARILIGTDTPEDASEVIRYDSIDRDRAQPYILFVRDRDLDDIVFHFYRQHTEDIGGGTSPTPDPTPDPDDPPPVPEPPDNPPPVPGDDGGGFGDPNPPNPDDPQDPKPGDGVPPGERPGGDGGEPGDTPPGDPGGGGDDGGFGDPSPDPGTDPGDAPEPGVDPGDGGGGGGDEFGDPVDPGDPNDEPGGLEDGGTDPREDGDGGGDEFGDAPSEDTPPEEGGGGGGGPGDGVPPGEGSDGGGGAQPPPEEPTPDESGGGGEFGDPDSGDGDGEGDGSIPDVPPPGGRDPEDEAGGDEGGEEPTGDVWEPPGGRSAALGTLDFRGANNTQRGGYDHSAGNAGNANSLFLPCFRVYEGWSGLILRTGRNDVITLTTGTESGATRIERGVRWGDDSTTWMALTDFVDTVFQAQEEGATARRNDPRGIPRILKFPCGELPDEMSDQVEFGQSAISGSGLVTAFLDELFIWTDAPDTRYGLVNAEGINEETDEIQIRNVGTTQDLATVAGYYEDCGVFNLEGELIIYRGLRREGESDFVLERCARGQFGTRATPHGYASKGRFMPNLPVAYLDGGMTAEASTIPVARTKDWPREGLVRIIRDDTAEMIHYTRRGDNELIMPTSLDADERNRDTGLFRGRFGTEAIDHDSDAIVIFQPFRYWDRFVQREAEDKDSFTGVYDHPDSSYLEVGKKARSAYWRGFTWNENLIGRLAGSEDESSDREGVLDIIVLARFSPNVPWDSTKIVDMSEEDSFGQKKDLAAKARDHLFYFDDVGDQLIGQSKDGNLLGIESDTAEFRVYFVYKSNAFIPVDDAGRQTGGARDEVTLTNSWKLTPWLRSFTLNYFTRTMSRYRAPLR